MLDVFALRGQSLSVSGNRPGYTGHIVDPRTGERLTGRLLAAVVSGDPLEAEVLSTAAFVAAGNAASEGSGAVTIGNDSNVRSVLEGLRAAFPDTQINIYRL